MKDTAKETKQINGNSISDRNNTHSKTIINSYLNVFNHNDLLNINETNLDKKNNKELTDSKNTNRR